MTSRTKSATGFLRGTALLCLLTGAAFIVPPSFAADVGPPHVLALDPLPVVAPPPALSPDQDAVPATTPPPAPAKTSMPADAQSDGFPTAPTAPASGPPRVVNGNGADSYFSSSPSPAVPSSTPRKVNPKKEPASKYVIVDKMVGSKGLGAQLTAADRALKLGHYDAAADMYDALYAKDPHDTRILMGRAVAYQNTGREKSALETYDQLLAIDHDNADALLNMLGLLSKQYPDVALRRLMNLHDQYPNNAMVAAQIGVTEAGMGQAADAQRYLGMAVSMDPNNAQHQFNLAVIEDKAGLRDKAVKDYEQALETDSVYGNGRSISREQIYDRLSALRQK